ncbi:MAG: DM13 domain-containing protein [Dehalococcoidia bacterium]|nr:DM13 domain-containing protein [Dehalococcoidia bacterium]
MEIFGEVERALSALYPYRVPVTVGGLAVVGLLAWFVVRRGWHARAMRFAAAHRVATALVAVVVLAVAIPAGDYLLSPLWERTTLVEASPLEVTATAVTVADETGTPATAAATTAPAPASDGPFVARVVSDGVWEGADDFHFARGRASLIETAPGRYTLRFEEFSIRNGPDLFVYLSDAADGYGEAPLKLGALKATDGAFNYDVPEGTDVSRYRSAIVWCDQFAVLFGTATLQ